MSDQLLTMEEARITSNTFELLHSRSFVQAPRLSPIALADEPKVEGNRWLRVGPHRASTSPPSGAKSDWHTHCLCSAEPTRHDLIPARSRHARIPRCAR
jgi:hypothetical protein